MIKCGKNIANDATHLKTDYDVVMNAQYDVAKEAFGKSMVKIGNMSLAGAH